MDEMLLNIDHSTYLFGESLKHQEMEVPDARHATFCRVRNQRIWYHTTYVDLRYVVYMRA
jgi:hypothetical protein